MSFPIKGPCYETQAFGLTAYARSVAGQKAYKAFGGIHPGIDLGTGGVNAPAIALFPAKVVRASADGGWGNHVELLPSDGWTRQYAHLKTINVKVGDFVEMGEEIGRVGTTGVSSGIHLHYGVRKRKPLGGFVYRDPTDDFLEKPPEPKWPAGRLIKATNDPRVYAFSGKMKFHIPDWETKTFLFGPGGGDIEVVEADIVSKIPEGSPFPSLK